MGQLYPPRTPRLGDMVYYVYGGKPLAAIVTDPANGLTVHVTVFPPGEPPFTALSAYDEYASAGTWRWPEDKVPT